MTEVRQGHWVVRCRICPKLTGKAECGSARDCHEWWRRHVQSDEHRNPPGIDVERLAHRFFGLGRGWYARRIQQTTRV